ncbi:MAG: hypothetical protein IJ219_04085 [Bacteroidaceae bacterium]|nr:hypothetical protein [Bacteroidaceae bacterium]MBQ9294089.1 hypothetical protein [Bacteroidaceae bacterium]
MKKIISLLMLLSALNVGAQKVELAVGEGWVEIPVQQTQSELKPGWKIVDYQMKSKLTHYLSGGHATQLADGNRPVFRVTPGEKEVLVDYVLVRLKASKYYRKMFKPLLIECNYTRLEPSYFDIKAESDSFICQPKQPLAPGEYILANLMQRPIGELQDLLVYPFCIAKE